MKGISDEVNNADAKSTSQWPSKPFTVCLASVKITPTATNKPQPQAVLCDVQLSSICHFSATSFVLLRRLMSFYNASSNDASLLDYFLNYCSCNYNAPNKTNVLALLESMSDIYTLLLQTTLRTVNQHPDTAVNALKSAFIMSLFLAYCLKRNFGKMSNTRPAFSADHFVLAFSR